MAKSEKYVLSWKEVVKEVIKDGVIEVDNEVLMNVEEMDLIIS